MYMAMSAAEIYTVYRQYIEALLLSSNPREVLAGSGRYLLGSAIDIPSNRATCSHPGVENI